ncbi:MAG: phytoene/squalene synthase family protein [Leptolyngbya foveolarum]|uniref:Phytoene/squalene synthase family protein n=1 Tax=Leptolyngbya foveolarum TaxID=47253 RepID=A0A2W4USC3_9CYAN|nr:MAG: phytoene/squalene synthase family protein [Leptolyngbya foveolarum]
MSSADSALSLLKATSRTFFIPISLLPTGLQEAVAAAYLCMRAIDQIEDNADMEPALKAQLLRQVSLNLQAGTADSTPDDFVRGLETTGLALEEVTLRIGEWSLLAPATIAPRIWDATAAMADRMAYWAERNWLIENEQDLDCYSFSVAGAVGLMLSDLWAWHDGTETNRSHAIGFGRGLQSINILRNHAEDMTRGVDFYPVGWTDADMQRYAKRNLALADAYIAALPKGPALTFCEIPLALANGTLAAIAQGKEKLSRSDVISIVARLTSGKFAPAAR